MSAGGQCWVTDGRRREGQQLEKWSFYLISALNVGRSAIATCSAAAAASAV